MFSNWHVLGEIALRTTAVYLVIFIGIRISGKREVGMMTPFDLTLLILLSNSVQNAMTGPDSSLNGGMVAAAVLLLLNYLVAELAGANRRFRKFIQGSPTMLIYQGKLLESHLAKEHITLDEVQTAMREHAIEGIREVAMAVLEVDGSISFLKFDDVPVTENKRHLKFLKRH